MSQLLAWGTIGLKCELNWDLCPGIIHKMSTKHTWKAYSDRTRYGVDQDTYIYGRSIFWRIDRMLSQDKLKRRSAVHYMLEVPLYDNMDEVHHIVDLEVGDIEPRRRLKKLVDVVIEYVKFYYSSHVGLDGNFLHNRHHALHTRTGGETGQLISRWERRLVPYQVFVDVADAVDNKAEEIRDTILNAAESLHLYMVHPHWAVNLDRLI